MTELIQGLAIPFIGTSAGAGRGSLRISDEESAECED